MRRPIRDEKWTDPEGTVWQVDEVGTWRTATRPPTADELKDGKPRRPIATGPFTFAYAVMRDKGGGTVRLGADELEAWSPAIHKNGERVGDPLAGHRARVAKAVRDGKSTLVFEGPSPVAKGDRFHVAGTQIVILKVTEGKNKRSEVRSDVLFSRLERDKVYLLRQTVPAARPGEVVGDGATPEDAERARIDGNYTSSAAQSDAANGGTDAGEAVPPDWEDAGAAARETKRQSDRREVIDQEAEVLKLAARIKQVGKEEARKGKDLTPLLEDIYARLAAEQKEAA